MRVLRRFHMNTRLKKVLRKGLKKVWLTIRRDAKNYGRLLFHSCETETGK
jgi:hypothetical protein